MEDTWHDTGWHLQEALGTAQDMQATYMRGHPGAPSSGYLRSHSFTIDESRQPLNSHSFIIDEGRHLADDLANVFDW